MCSFLCNVFLCNGCKNNYVLESGRDRRSSAATTLRNVCAKPRKARYLYNPSSGEGEFLCDSYVTGLFLQLIKYTAVGHLSLTLRFCGLDRMPLFTKGKLIYEGYKLSG